MIIFAYMYQVNIPLISYELERRNAKRMSTVLVRGSVAAVILYALVGIFGYLTFVNSDKYPTTNVLESPYGNNIPILIVISF